jgi:hypothetical protein
VLLCRSSRCSVLIYYSCRLLFSEEIFVDHHSIRRFLEEACFVTPLADFVSCDFIWYVPNQNFTVVEYSYAPWLKGFGVGADDVLCTPTLTHCRRQQTENIAAPWLLNEDDQWSRKACQKFHLQGPAALQPGYHESGCRSQDF